MITKEQLFKKFEPRKCETQAEFETIMGEINFLQGKECATWDDRLYCVEQHRLDLVNEINKLTLMLSQHAMSRSAAENEKKQLNRIFHELKHEFIKLNPRESFIKEEEQ